MSQFTESQMSTIRDAIEFLATTQRAAHNHVAANVQEVFDLFNPVFAEEVVTEEVVAEEVAVEEETTEEVKPAKAKKAK